MKCLLCRRPSPHASFCRATCKELFAFVGGKRGRDPSIPPADPEHSPLMDTNTDVLLEILYNMPLDELGAVCSTHHEFKDLCRTRAFKSMYLRRHWDELPELFTSLLDRDEPLLNTFRTWVRVALENGWDPTTEDAIVWDTAAGFYYPEAMEVFMPSLLVFSADEEPYAGIPATYLEEAIRYFVRRMDEAPNQMGLQFRRPASCLALTLQSTRVTLALKGIDTLRRLVRMGLRQLFQAAMRRATHPTVVDALKSDATKARFVTDAAIAAPNSQMIDYFVAPRNRQDYLQFVTVNDVHACIAKDYQSAVHTILSHQQHISMYDHGEWMLERAVRDASEDMVFVLIQFVDETGLEDDLELVYQLIVMCRQRGFERAAAWFERWVNESYEGEESYDDDDSN